jgi:hypothetical protein
VVENIHFSIFFSPFFRADAHQFIDSLFAERLVCSGRPDNQRYAIPRYCKTGETSGNGRSTGAVGDDDQDALARTLMPFSTIIKFQSLTR